MLQSDPLNSAERSAATADAVKSALQDPDFVRLVRRKNAVSLVYTVLILVVYYGFVMLLAFGKEFLGGKLSGSITIGIPVGLGVIIMAWLLTGFYVRWANREYDALVARVRADFDSKA